MIGALLVATAVALSGCPAKTRRTLVPVVPTTGDSQARARFDQAQRRFERDDQQVATEFEAIANKYPDDPIAPHAMLYAGMAAVRAADYQKAIAILDKLDREPGIAQAVRARGRLFLGVALGYAGHHARALPHLQRGEPAIASDAERGEWLAAMAEALGRGSAPRGAAPYYDRWDKIASPAEHAYITAARQRLGLVSPAPPVRTSGSADPNLIGAVLALSGRGARVGDLALRGLAMASGAVNPAASAPFVVSVRDSRSRPALAEEGVSELAARGVIGVIGPMHRRSVARASAKAAALGLPLITLDQRSRASASPFVFHAVHSAEDRARSLARYAHGLGVRDFAIFAPSNGYGRAVGGAFRKEVVKLGGTVVVSRSYAPKATSFGKSVRGLRKPWQALFVPDQATRLSLIAPSLAAGNFVSRPWTAKRPRRGRKILLLSTAEFLTQKYVRNAGRYSVGAVFAPGFYPDRFDAAIRSYVDRYESAFHRVPTVFDAYAYDAAMVLRAAVATGARTRGALGTALIGVRMDGLTGQVRFGADRRRADDGLLYRVQADDTGALQIRVQRTPPPAGG